MLELMHHRCHNYSEKKENTRVNNSKQTIRHKHYYTKAFILYALAVDWLVVHATHLCLLANTLAAAKLHILRKM